MTRSLGVALALPALLVAFPAFAQAQFAGARYNTNGSLDVSFDGDGKVLTNFGTTAHEAANALAMDAQRRVILAGFAGENYFPSPIETQFALVRYAGDGALDTTFDGDGKVFTDFASSSTEFITGVAVQADGKIVAGGTAIVDGDSRFALARYNTDGSMDTSFDRDGKVLTAFGPPGTHAAGEGILIASDGKIIVCGTFSDGRAKFALARYNTDGSLDATFGDDGTVVVDFTSMEHERASACALTPTGKIVLGGSASTSILNSMFAAARFNTDGSLDKSFDADGKVLADSPALEHEEVRDIIVEANDRIVSVGSGDSNNSSVLAVVRHTWNGALDPAFGSGGWVITNLPESTHEYAGSVAFATGGRIVVAGTANVSGSAQFLLVRYTSGGLLDSTFDGDGRVFTNFASTEHEVVRGVLLDPFGRLVVAGFSH